MYNDYEYDEIYRVDASDEWRCGAYDEDGDQVYCEACGDELLWDPRSRTWRCSSCGNEKNRIQFFNYIGADPPFSRCLTRCMENYPLCRQDCPLNPADHRKSP